MAENKKSFLLYCDTINTVRKLSDEQAGLLFKHILMYVNDENPVTDNFIIEIAFEPIKQQLKRDLIKYEEIIEKRRIAGLASAELRKQNQQLSTRVESVEQTPTNPTDNVNVSVSDSVNDNDLKEIPPNPQRGDGEIIPENPILIPEKEEKEKSSGKKEKFDLNFVSVAYLTIVKDFIEYRKHIKKPFKTERGVQMFYNELLTLSKNNLQKAQTLVDYAKDKEWQTVYEIKENGKNQSNSATTKERNLESLARNIEQGVARALAEQ